MHIIVTGVPEGSTKEELDSTGNALEQSLTEAGKNVDGIFFVSAYSPDYFFPGFKLLVEVKGYHPFTSFGTAEVIYNSLRQSFACLPMLRLAGVAVLISDEEIYFQNDGSEEESAAAS